MHAIVLCLEVNDVWAYVEYLSSDVGRVQLSVESDIKIDPCNFLSEERSSCNRDSSDLKVVNERNSDRQLRLWHRVHGVLRLPSKSESEVNEEMPVQDNIYSWMRVARLLSVKGSSGIYCGSYLEYRW